MAKLIFHPEDGIFLGSCLGLGFWSRLDPVGQDCAVTFETEGQAREHLAGSSLTPEHLAQLRYVEVKPDMGVYASIDACVAAGLPAWNPQEGCRDDVANAPSLPRDRS